MGIRLKPMQPSRWRLIRLNVAFHIIRNVLKLLFSTFIRIDIHGAEHIPKRGPILVLSNHVGFFDPFVICMATGRMVQFLATPTMFTKPLLGPIAKFFGVVPKRKFYADLNAITRLIEWARLGSSVGLFPEGQRSWDGRTLEIVPGIGKLVRLIDAPVVTLRMYNMDRLSPRWAIKQRKGHVIVKIDAPIRFEKSSNPAAIETEIQKRISVIPNESPPALVYGNNLALGIRNVLFLCPNCFSVESLRERHNDVYCDHCQAGWHVRANNVLTKIGTGETTPLLTMFDTILSCIKSCGWIVDGPRYELDGVVLESDDMQLLDISGRRPREIGRGRLQLTENNLQLAGDTSWRLSLTDLMVATVDLSTDLQFRSRYSLFAAVLRNESVVKWEIFVNYWQKSARQLD